MQMFTQVLIGEVYSTHNKKTWVIVEKAVNNIIANTNLPKIVSMVHI